MMHYSWADCRGENDIFILYVLTGFIFRLFLSAFSAQYNRHKKQIYVGCWLSSKYKLMALVSMLSIDQATKRHRHSKFTKSDDINRMNIFGRNEVLGCNIFFFALQLTSIETETVGICVQEVLSSTVNVQLSALERMSDNSYESHLIFEFGAP